MPCVCALAGGKHTVTRRNNDCSWCEREREQVGYFQVLDVRPGVHLSVCVYFEQAYEGVGSHRGLSDISKVNSDESYRSWEYMCTRV